jgi:microcystin-dependent protein
MAEAFLGEIRLFGFNFAPFGWMMCNGQILPISQYAALFSLLGTQFGGNGTSNFGLPNLQGNVPVGQGQGQSSYAIGEASGVTTVALTQAEMTLHNHLVPAVPASAATGSPRGAMVAQGHGGGRGSFLINSYATAATNTTLPPAPASAREHDHVRPYLGEIRTFGFAFAPKGWAMCNGQILPINQYQALFALLGTQYGGNGVNTFALPDLRGRVALHVSGTLPQGQQFGEEGHTLTGSELPQHTHLVDAVGSPGTTNQPGGTVYLAGGISTGSGTPAVNIYAAASPAVPMAPLGIQGGSQPHENRMPFLVLNYCIAMIGIFPSRN